LKDFKIPQSLLLTATATPVVIEDMKTKFAISKDNVVLTGFYRANLHLAVEPVTTQNKNQALLYWLNQYPNQSCIVYVTLQKSAEDVASFLASNGINATAYHAGMQNDVRQQIQQDFMQSKYHCIVATIAFGMGIDKSDIRQVIHYDLPKSIESYSQEIGRAGRDNQPSVCVVLANADNLNVLENFVYGDTPELAGIIKVLEQIKTTMTIDDGQWETMPLPLSNLSNIRQLPIKTLLVYLQLNNIIEPMYSYYADYRYKVLQSESELLNHFEGERRAFVSAILQSSDKARTWYTMNFDRLYQGHQADRGRAITALEYFNEKNYIELEAKQMTDVYRVLSPDFDTAQLASDLFGYFQSKEQSEIDRITNMLAFFQSSRCLSQQLAQYFDDNQLQSPCGHCSVCSGHIAVLPKPTSLKALKQLDFHQLCDGFINACPDTPSTDLIARFLCGISVPIFTKIKARKQPGFAQLEHYRYGEVKAWIEDCRG
jgi:ATP-dependent DNA helicase RecQ